MGYRLKMETDKEARTKGRKDSGMLRDWYRGGVMNALRQDPEEYLQVLLDVALESIAREGSTDKMLWLAEKVGIKVKRLGVTG